MTAIRLGALALLLAGCNCGPPPPPEPSDPVDAGPGCLAEDEVRQRLGTYADMVVRMPPPAGTAKVCTVWKLTDDSPDGSVYAREYKCSNDYARLLDCAEAGKSCYQVVSRHCVYGWVRLK